MPEPSALKSFQQELEHQAYGETPADHCVNCKRPFSGINVHSDAGWRETRISKMCEDCWDQLFSGGDQ